jgi:Holliday junction resolvase-like predicted endonuclease
MATAEADGETKSARGGVTEVDGGGHGGSMPIVSRMIFELVNLRARRGLAEEAPAEQNSSAAKPSAEGAASAAKLAARRTGIRGETFAYWYLRRRGYVIVARNFMAPGVKGEIDLAGYDGKVLAFIEVKTRAITTEQDAKERAPGNKIKILPEDAVTPAKRHSLVRVAKQFMMEWRVSDGNFRFDVLAIESRPGAAPVVRLHKDCFGISGRV